MDHESAFSRPSNFTPGSRDNNQQLYQYQELQGSSTIRLIRLLPGSELDLIRCELIVVDLYDIERNPIPLRDAGLITYASIWPNLKVVSIDKALGFVALSYTWGGQEQNEHILCSDQALALTLNLHLALKQLRSETGTMILWADAICINQADVKEKSHQVGLMSEIYSKAIAVVAWLGEANDNTVPAIGLIDHISSRFTHEQPPTYAEIGSIIERDWVQDLGLPSFLEPEWRSLGYFFANPYFQRAWIIQEISFAKELHFQIGHYSIPFDRVVNAAAFLESTLLVANLLKGEQARSPRPGLLIITNNIRQATKEDTPRSLGWLLNMSTGYSATDKRDKVIAMLGLGPGQGKQWTSLALVPDYRKSTGYFYREATGYILSQESDTKILSCVHDVIFKKTSDRLPSWVPDYSVHHVPATLGTSKFIHRDSITYTAGAGRYSKISWVSGSETIKIYDTINVDVIREISPSPNGLPGEGSVSDTLLEWFKMFSATIRDGFHIVSQADFDACEPFWRNIIANRHAFRYPAPDSCGREFLATLLTFGMTSGSMSDMNQFVEMYEEYNVEIGSFFHDFSLVSTARRFFITEKGRLGIGPWSSKAGDQIFVIGGCLVPLVLRHDNGGRNGDDQTHSLVGECYVHGVMDGETFEDSQLELIDIVLQ